MLKERLEERLKNMGYELYVYPRLNGNPYQKRFYIKQHGNIIKKYEDLNAVEDWIIEKTYFKRVQ